MEATYYSSMFLERKVRTGERPRCLICDHKVRIIQVLFCVM